LSVPITRLWLGVVGWTQTTKSSAASPELGTDAVSTVGMTVCAGIDTAMYRKNAAVAARVSVLFTVGSWLS
jgi:hypothetical protein